MLSSAAPKGEMVKKNAVTAREGARESVQVIVRDNDVDQALRVLKKKMQREGMYREMKRRRHYEKPSERKAREKAAAVRRARKLARKAELPIFEGMERE